MYYGHIYGTPFIESFFNHREKCKRNSPQKDTVPELEIICSGQTFPLHTHSYFTFLFTKKHNTHTYKSPE